MNTFEFNWNNIQDKSWEHIAYYIYTEHHYLPTEFIDEFGEEGLNLIFQIKDMTPANLWQEEIDEYI